MSKILDGVWVDKITVVYLNADDMETVNLLTSRYPDHEVNFVDKSEFEEIEELKGYVDELVFNAIMYKDLDYVVFRFDE